MSQLATPTSGHDRGGQPGAAVPAAALASAAQFVALLLGQSSMRPLTILLCQPDRLGASSSPSAGAASHSWRRKSASRWSGGIVGILLDLLFLSLAVLLVFSSGLILYGSLFTAAETAFLLSKPVRGRPGVRLQVSGRGRLQQLGLPAAGRADPDRLRPGCERPWYFYALLPLFFLGFVLLPGSLGGLVCLLMVNYVPQRRKQVLGAGLVAAGWSAGPVDLSA